MFFPGAKADCRKQSNMRPKYSQMKKETLLNNLEDTYRFSCFVFCRSNITSLNCQHDSIHQVLGSLDKRSGTVKLSKKQV